MSKSLGNGVDPMDLIDEYGADSLRFYLATDVAMGTDLRFDKEKVASTWNFINKLWNASRFVLMNIEDLTEVNLENLNIHDKWILTKYEQTIKKVKKHMDKYEFNIVGSTLYDFIWDCFCDKYIEMSKFTSNTIETKSTLYTVLTGIIKMLHPFMPYVTEEIYQMLPIKETDSIMISNYPEYNKNLVYKTEEVDNAIEFITLFRNKKKELNIKDFSIIPNIENEEIKTLILNMLKLNDKQNNNNYELTQVIKLNNLSIEILYNDEIDHELEKENLLKEKEKLIMSIERRKKLLSNENYVNKAPANVVENDRIQLEKEQAKLDEILKKIN
jgi:valyl-tRNA synthetase